MCQPGVFSFFSYRQVIFFHTVNFHANIFWKIGKLGFCVEEAKC